jgi:hypothetical protein
MAEIAPSLRDTSRTWEISSAERAVTEEQGQVEAGVRVAGVAEPLVLRDVALGPRLVANPRDEERQGDQTVSNAKTSAGPGRMREAAREASRLAPVRSICSPFPSRAGQSCFGRLL